MIEIGFAVVVCLLQLLERFIRAMNPWPGAWTSASSPDGAAKVRLRVVKAELSSAALSAGSGKVEGDAFIVGGSAGALKIAEIQPEGKRPMSVAEFLRGAGKKLVGESRWG